MENYFLNEGVNQWKTWVINGGIVEKLIAGHGYVNSYQNIFVYLNNYDGNKEKILNTVSHTSPIRINFHIGDTDAI